MYDTLKLFEESVSDMTYIVPKQDNWTLEPVKAGKLTMAYGNLSDETFDKHFVAIRLRDSNMEDFPLNAAYMIQEYSKVLQEIKNNKTFEKIVNLEVASCMRQCNFVRRYIGVDDWKINEAAVRMLGGTRLL